ncbi:MAG: nucleotidyltransferase family protein [Candidatus Atribacteria bacterium]|nr:nucleotidyltransferase family protein [Candidatus Atribacteria bacterium]
MAELKKHKDEVENTYHAKILGIFGSYARGEASQESDIDVLVDFNDKVDLFDLVELSIFLEEKIGWKVDIVAHDTIHSKLKSQIVAETIYL